VEAGLQEGGCTNLADLTRISWSDFVVHFQARGIECGSTTWSLDLILCSLIIVFMTTRLGGGSFDDK
jgi:hypothetical protein